MDVRCEVWLTNNGTEFSGTASTLPINYMSAKQCKLLLLESGAVPTA